WVRVDDERVRVVHDLGSAAELHGHARAELDVHELVHHEARGERDQIEWRSAFEQEARRRGARDAGAMLLKSGARPLLAREDEGGLGNARHVERAPRHRFDLGSHLPIALLDAATEELEFEQLGAHVDAQSRGGGTRLAMTSQFGGGFSLSCGTSAVASVPPSLGMIMRLATTPGPLLPPQAT